MYVLSNLTNVRTPSSSPGHKTFKNVHGGRNNTNSFVFLAHRNIWYQLILQRDNKMIHIFGSFYILYIFYIKRVRTHLDCLTRKSFSVSTSIAQ